MNDFATARFNMVEGQVRPNKVTDMALLTAMLNVPRERFVPEAQRSLAYIDNDVQIGRGRALLGPMVFGRLLQEVGVQPGDVVLDVGCATGYSTAILARLARAVVGLESDAELAQQASANLVALGVDNAAIMTGPLAEGYAKQAPYDVIVIAGAVAEVPDALTAQLAEGGRLITVVRSQGLGKATLIQRTGGVLGARIVFDASAAMLPGFEEKPQFVF